MERRLAQTSDFGHLLKTSPVARLLAMPFVRRKLGRVLSIPLLYEILGRDKAQRRGVETIANSRRGRSIMELVAEMAIRPGRTDIG